MRRCVNIEVKVDGEGASDALHEAALEPAEGIDLGNGASVSRALLLSQTFIEWLTVTADVATLATAVATLAHWLYNLSRRKGVVIEKIGRTTIEHATEDEIVRVLHEEIERRIESE